METFKTIAYSIENSVLVVTVPCRDFVMEQAQDVVDLVFDRFDPGPEYIVLDLGPVEYINSSGISVVIRLNLERKLVLVRPSRMVRDILELTGVLPFVPEAASVEEAVSRLS